MPLNCTVHTSPETFGELHAEWHELLAHSITNHIFQTPEFLETWWHTLGQGELHILTFRNPAGQLVGLAPLFTLVDQSGVRQVHFIGCVDVTDYLDLLVHPEWAEEVYPAVFSHLQTLEKGTRYKLCSIPDSSPTISAAQNRVSAEQLQITQQDVTPLIQLPASWEDYLAQLDRKQRHELKRKWGKLERETTHLFQVVEKNDDVTAATERFISLHKASSPGKNRFWDDHHVAFFSELLARFAQAGWLRLYFLQVDGQDVASMLIFEYAERFYLYNSGYDPSFMPQLSTGNTLLAYTIQDAISRQMKLYDFLRGDETYKFRFGAVASPVWDIEWKK